MCGRHASEDSWRGRCIVSQTADAACKAAVFPMGGWKGQVALVGIGLLSPFLACCYCCSRRKKKKTAAKKAKTT